MKCPFCRETNTEVYNSRDTKSGNQVWRRRRCQSCQKPFTTYEFIDLGFIYVIKNNGKKERYSRAKLFSGIYQAFSVIKSKSETIDAVTDTIESKILCMGKTVISTEEIAYVVLATLNHFNTTAFLRYLSQHTELASNSQLKKELKKY
jgi:transcriptional repressor NrdR